MAQALQDLQMSMATQGAQPIQAAQTSSAGPASSSTLQLQAAVPGQKGKK